MIKTWAMLYVICTVSIMLYMFLRKHRSQRYIIRYAARSLIVFLVSIVIFVVALSVNYNWATAVGVFR